MAGGHGSSSTRTWLPSKPAPPGSRADSPTARVLSEAIEELTRRRLAGEASAVETLFSDRGALDDESRAALAYEDFCLREEAGEAPVPQEYYERFPELANALRRIFDIHEFIGDVTFSDVAEPKDHPRVEFPPPGDRLAGYRLVAELGRGSFARVYLAEECRLASRLVALKVSTVGGRETRTLARLQHTNIVPVYSHLIDEATGFHLQCMPYFGRVTLERLLEVPRVGNSATGADLLSALERLDPGQAQSRANSPSRTAFARLPHSRAIAWWAARLAEALAHAHERGVLHRDVKPSNVLVTADGTPMLLDFNLSKDLAPVEYGEESAERLGGTFAYMSPEHLEGIASRTDSGIDERSDLYSLGALLFEALCGRRPFPPPNLAASSVADALQQAADLRKHAVPDLRAEHPEIPDALASLVERCLSPDPTRRHSNARALAEDLQAVADDQPLPHSTEPIARRVRRWGRHNRGKISAIPPAALIAFLLINGANQLRLDHSRLVQAAREFLAEGRRAADSRDWPQARDRFDSATRVLKVRGDSELDPTLLALLSEARSGTRDVARRIDAIRRYESFLAEDDAFRSAWIDAGGPAAVLSPAMKTRLAALLDSFSVHEDAALEGPPREDVRRRSEELLFQVACARKSNDPANARVVSRALAASTSPLPWKRLLEGSKRVETQVQGSDVSASACHLLSWLSERDGRSSEALDWSRKAADRAPREFLYRYRLAALLRRLGQPSEADVQFLAAESLKDRRPSRL